MSFIRLQRFLWASLVAQRLKRLPPMRETRVRSLGWEDPLEKEMVTHSSILAWKIPRTEKSGRLQSMGSQRVGHDWATSLHIWNKCKFEIYIWNSSDSTEHTHLRVVFRGKMVQNETENAGRQHYLSGIPQGSSGSYACTTCVPCCVSSLNWLMCARVVGSRGVPWEAFIGHLICQASLSKWIC